MNILILRGGNLSAMNNELTRRGALKTGAALATGGAFVGTASAEHDGSVITVGDDGDFTTIQAALDHANDGDTVRVHEGDYDEAIRVTASNLTIEAVDDDVVIAPTEPEQMDPRNRIVDLSDASGTTFAGFTVEGLGSSSDDVAVYTGNLGSNDSITDNVLRAARGGITVGTGVEGVVVARNDVSETVEGITLLSNPESVEENTISESTGGLVTFGGKYEIDPFEPQNNTFEDNDVQVDDGSGNFDLQQLLEDNEFDRAVVVPDSSVQKIFSSIQDGVDQAMDGDTVEVLEGEYDETVRFTADGLALVAPDGATIAPTRRTIDENPRGRIVDFNARTDGVFRGFDVTGTGDTLDDPVGVTINGEDGAVEDVTVGDVLTGVQTSSGGADGATIENLIATDVGVGISIQSSDALVTSSSVDGTRFGGIGVLDNGDVDVENCDLDNSDGPLVSVHDGGGGGSLTLKNSNFGADGLGVLNTEDSYTVDAEQNWWGARNGPERDAGNSGRSVGDGARVEGDVDFTPWLREPA